MRAILLRRLFPLILRCTFAVSLALYSCLEVYSEEISFNREIRPILAEHCFNCHGQDEKSRKGKLRLDDREAAIAGGKSGKPGIAPGDAGKSELMVRITTQDGDDLMPPPEAKNPLSPKQIETLRKWIESGAKYEGHWAFQKPTRPAVPQEEVSRGAASPVDAFVVHAMKQRGLSLSPEATPEQLLRRLSLDIAGVPPSLKALDQFIVEYPKDPERVWRETIETLLSSPAFGEKWARWWLDAARYADSDGYEKDLPREQWAWRDWVIQRLNEDQPFDQFIIEQVAGDLLPGSTQEQKIATGFFRNGMVNEEGAIINEQFRLEGMFDRMDVVGKSILGLTLQCAQCHSHKFDPLTHEEYFGLFAFLNNSYEATSWIHTQEQRASIQRIEKEIAATEADLKKRWPDWGARLEAWEQEVGAREVRWEILDAIEQEWIGGLAHPEKSKDQSILTLGFRPTTGELFVTGMTQRTNITALRLEAMTHGDLPFRGPGRSYNGTFAVSELYVEAAPISVVGANTNQAFQIKSGLVKVPLTNAVADIETAERQVPEKFRKKEDKRTMGPARFLIDGNDDTGWSPDLGPFRRHVDSQVVMQFATNGWASVEGTFLKVWLKFRHGGSDAHGRENMFLGRFRLAYTTDPDPAKDTIPRTVREALKVAKADRTEEEERRIFNFWRNEVPEFKEWNDRIESLWKEYPEGGQVLNLVEREGQYQRDTFLLDRGNWQTPKNKIMPGVPAFLHPMRGETPRNRLGFAQWLVDPESPTTARVTVNRIWQSIFGQGLLETPEDFGVRAPLPTHPELLDWLAMEFMKPADGNAPSWSLKHVVRTIVGSAVYRQSSRVSREILEVDPRNRWLTRAPRFRADSEQVRDSALFASGLLHEKIGGPSFYPPVPESLFALNFVKIDWTPAPIPERYRRSLYMFRRRSMPDPVMASFDAPNGDFACVRRVRSNTPLAALTLLNEPVFVEAARHLALRTLKESGPDETQRIQYAFRLCTSRVPKEHEIKTLKQLMDSQRRRLAEGWISALEIAFAENRLPPLPDGTTPQDVAAWTILSRVLLNMDETMSKQ
ncbi:MAG: PSD1 and planctomycete cytochrome C domain-containing protein [Verrucomicrobiota bacterium]|nr:PSD1 and planctomycete cytochrome C domain-containing protein [Verrucomicrobiota bacterium]